MTCRKLCKSVKFTLANLIFQLKTIQKNCSYLCCFSPELQPVILVKTARGLSFTGKSRGLSVVYCLLINHGVCQRCMYHLLITHQACQRWGLSFTGKSWGLSEVYCLLTNQRCLYHLLTNRWGFCQSFVKHLLGNLDLFFNVYGISVSRSSWASPLSTHLITC